LRWDFRADRPGVREDRSAFVIRCEQWMASALRNPRWCCFVAETGTSLVGQVWVEIFEKIPNPTDEPERHAYITNMYVRPERRNAGIGGRLLEAAISWSVGQRPDTMFLWPTPRSRPFYARHGFVPADAILIRRG
jgi:GNAT superfamily N-acetyltransferase